MNRKDIPNWIGKRVSTTNLKATEWNGKSGLVVDWNDERERFAVKMDRDGSVKLFKPFNLFYTPSAQNEKESELANLVITKTLVEFEHGMELFDQLGASEKYMHTWLKISWLKHLSDVQAKQDKRYVEKIQAALENIIESSQFEDLVVHAKINLACLFSWTGNINQKIDLVMSCVGAHYGYLPDIFCAINATTDNFEFVKDIYFRSKLMVVNKTCTECRCANFIEASTNFLHFCKLNDKSVNTTEECIFLRQTLESLLESSVNSDPDLSLANICMLEENYEEGLRNIQIYQEHVTSATGNVDLVCHCYRLKVDCYIHLGNKSMAKKVLQKYKRFRSLSGVNRNIVSFEKLIKKMSNTNSTTQVQENQVIRTRTQCSNYECKKVEPQVGAFKHCGRCRLKYYCSIKCQKKHWKNGHEEECKEFEN